MIELLAKNSAVIWDSKTPPDEIQEQPIIVQNYTGSKSIGITDHRGEVTIPYRMIDELCRAMKDCKHKK